jgi:acylphosphatase
MSSENVGRAFRAVGLVQGVGFRWFAREIALRHGATGWVQNRPDDSVHGEIFGSPDSVSKALGEIARGPTLGRVDNFETSEIAPQHFSGFMIRK